MGIASKDGSVVKANNIKMENVNFLFYLLIKNLNIKLQIYLLKISILKITLGKWLTDKNSKIFFENIPVGNIFKQIIPLVYRKDIDLINQTS